MNLDLSDAIRCRNRFLFALGKGKTDRARSILLRHYLPALRDLQVSTDREIIKEGIAVRWDRLTEGLQVLDCNGAWKYPEEKHDKLALRLLAEYEVLFDCWSMKYEGKDIHPINYLMDRVDAREKRQ